MLSFTSLAPLRYTVLSFTPASPSSPFADGEKRAPASGCPFFWWTIKGSFSRELRARSSAALTVHRTVIHSRFPFEPFSPMAKNGHPLRGVRFLVDHQGLEPWTDRL